MLMIRKSEQKDGKGEQHIHTYTWRRRKQKKNKSNRWWKKTTMTTSKTTTSTSYRRKEFHWIVVFIYNVAADWNACNKFQIDMKIEKERETQKQKQHQSNAFLVKCSQFPHTQWLPSFYKWQQNNLIQHNSKCLILRLNMNTLYCSTRKQIHNKFTPKIQRNQSNWFVEMLFGSQLVCRIQLKNLHTYKFPIQY